MIMTVIPDALALAFVIAAFYALAGAIEWVNRKRARAIAQRVKPVREHHNPHRAPVLKRGATKYLKEGPNRTSRIAFEKAYPTPPGATQIGYAYRYLATANISIRIDHGMHADRWETWKASRSCLVVELPPGQYGPAADAIRAAGVRVKIAPNTSK